MNLTRFDNNGTELLIDLDTGKVYASQGMVAKMCECKSQQIAQFGRSGINSIQSLPVIDSMGRNHQTKLYPEELILQCLAKYNPPNIAVFIKSVKAGTGRDIDSSKLVFHKRIVNNNEGRRKSDHLYIIQCSETGVIKIGISCSPEGRITALQTAYPHTLDLIFSKVVKNARRVESELHKSLKDFRLRGEWFLEDCLQFIDTASIS